MRALPHPRTAVDKLAVVVASFFGTGFAPKASGTVGTLAAMPLVWWSLQGSIVVQTLVFAFIFAIAVPSAARTGKLAGVVDTGVIVIDEVAGVLVAAMGAAPTWPNLVAIFLLFRLFDITKPWPASYFDSKVKNGFGVVMDDVVAGLFARAVLFGLALVWPEVFP